MEDARATCSVAIWCLQNGDQLQEWPAAKLSEHLRKQSQEDGGDAKRIRARRATERQVLSRHWGSIGMISTRAMSNTRYKLCRTRARPYGGKMSSATICGPSLFRILTDLGVAPCLDL